MNTSFAAQPSSHPSAGQPSSYGPVVWAVAVALLAAELLAHRDPVNSALDGQGLLRLQVAYRCGDSYFSFATACCARVTAASLRPSVNVPTRIVRYESPFKT
jgi:hypothetical protein